MKILGIDTILHDACIAVMDDNWVLSNEKSHTSMSLANQSLLTLTAIHVKEIGATLREALKKANISMNDISLIAANNSGSLLSNVLIGLIVANTLSATVDAPIIDVSHQEGHIFSNWIERNPADFNFPILVFSASGGHSLTTLLHKDDFKFNVISESRGIKGGIKNITEFAGVGFLFSKIVSWLRLNKYRDDICSDGDFISRLAKKGNPKRFIFTPKKEKKYFYLEPNLNGLMVYMYRLIRKEKTWHRVLSDKFSFDVAASFENALAEIITDYLCYLGREHKVKEIHLAGGISANEVIRSKFIMKTSTAGLTGRYPKMKLYCTDNAAMIANAGYYKFIQAPEGYAKNRYLDIKSDLVLERMAIEQFIKAGKRLG
jgi:N6-L-threonylcarbamoyladenine synthase